MAGRRKYNQEEIYKLALLKGYICLPSGDVLNYVESRNVFVKIKLKKATNSDSYYFSLWDRERNTAHKIYISLFVYWFFKRSLPNWVFHLDGCPTNNAIGNLSDTSNII